MQKRFYLDTCIWRDLLEDRKSNYSFLGENAFQFLRKCRENDCIVLVSSFVVSELETYFSKEQIFDLFEPFNDITLFVEPSKESIRLAYEIGEKSSAHYSDIVHALIAKENECVLITRDKHFNFLTELVKVLLPEEVDFS